MNKYIILCILFTINTAMAYSSLCDDGKYLIATTNNTTVVDRLGGSDQELLDLVINDSNEVCLSVAYVIEKYDVELSAGLKDSFYIIWHISPNGVVSVAFAQPPKEIYGCGIC